MTTFKKFLEKELKEQDGSCGGVPKQDGTGKKMRKQKGKKNKELEDNKEM